MITLLNVDCMEYMSTVPDKHFDLAIVDPPYGIGQHDETLWESADGNKKKSITHTLKKWDQKPMPKEYFVELKRVSKNQIIWGANHFIENINCNSSCWIVWDKDQQGTTGHADCELAYTSFKTAVRKAKVIWNGFRQQDMKNKEVRIHPTQKPIHLYNWIFNKYAQPKQRILDTHLGSGSSAISAYYFDMNFVGCEIDKDYFDAAQKRFKQLTAQTTLL